MNSVQLIGRLTRDPELRQTPSGKSVGGLRLAVDRRDRDADPIYVDVTVWNALVLEALLVPVDARSACAISASSSQACCSSVRHARLNPLVILRRERAR